MWQLQETLDDISFVQVVHVEAIQSIYEDFLAACRRLHVSVQVKSLDR